ncbi:MAG: serine/threonine-protein phosphatase, partial [Clostridia bacterium]|nr:serine/threonine-protein phosphatase [Clostridia bacterium]
MNIKGFSDKGVVRSSNQDAFMVGMMDDGSSWAVVCDGMGGANGGNVASRLAVDYFSASLKAGYRNGMSESSVKNLLESAVNAANIRVFDKSRESKELNGMGTTIVATLIIGNVAYFIHAGDSRAYSFSNGELSQITRDHSIVQSM